MANDWVSEWWVIKIDGISQDIKVHVIHISHMVIIYTLESLSSLT